MHMYEYGAVVRNINLVRGICELGENRNCQVCQLVQAILRLPILSSARCTASRDVLKLAWPCRFSSRAGHRRNSLAGGGEYQCVTSGERAPQFRYETVPFILLG